MLTYDEQFEMFGTTTEELQRMSKEARSVKMLVISLLSDAQEQQELTGDNRRTLNAVKYIVDNFLFE